MFLPVKHVVVVYDDVSRELQAARFAKNEVLADLPVRAVLALSDKQLNFRCGCRFSDRLLWLDVFSVGF